MAPFRVVIIGGGLSGPLLGNGLMNNNVDFTLYERDNENARYEGYQIRLGEGALRGFSACLTPAHQETIMRKLGKSVDAVETAPSLFTSGFEQLLDLTTVQSYSKSAAINRVVLRDLLMEPLRRNTKVEYQKEFVDYEAVPGSGGAADKIKVNFRDGSSDTCDILVGADGSHSKMNSQVGLSNLVPIKSHWSFLLKGKLPYERMAELPANHRMLSLGESDDGTDIHITQFTASTKPALDWRKNLQRNGATNQGNPHVWLLGDAAHAMQPNRA
ncbi:hypothetical protein E8E14_013719 [Neopestalotiopsis sp. 37M]|nr:hypothetical protein E8E14_013719 [Neopestalotiopsis sp. 37M]